MKKEMPKPRDPFVIHLVAKKQGAHQKSKKNDPCERKSETEKEYLDKAA
jgi:hypothetical protein